MTTFSREADLPALPLPQCTSLPALLPELLAPIVDAETLGNTMQSLAQFLDGDGPVLEQALAKWREQQHGNGSWLGPLWEKDYLSFRGPLPINMNYTFLLDTRWNFSAGGLLSSLVAVMQSLAQEKLPTEMIKDTPLSMHHCRTMFYTRLPLPDCDSLHTVPMGGVVTAAVACNGFWHILSLTDATGRPFTAQAIETALADIRIASEGPSPKAPLGAMTTAPRDAAAALRASLMQKEQNRLSLSALENTAIVLCLDNAVDDTGSSTSLCHNALCGPAANRWYDKSIQIISPQHGPLGVNFEHTGCDGSTWCYILSIAVKTMQDPSACQAKGQPQSQRLSWDITDDAQEKLRNMESDYNEQVHNLDMHCIDPDNRFGKEAVKALQCSPDAFVQAALQCAQLELFGEFVSCYEAFSMRHYAQGRTECARPSSLQAKALAQAIKEKQSPEVLRTLFSAMANEHKKRLAQCRKGEAIERFIYGLKSMYAIFGKTLGFKELPPFFNDPGLLALGKSRLSTSGLDAPFVSHFGFGPVEQDGLGAGYMERSEAFSLVVTGFRGTSPCPCDFANAFVRPASTVAAALKTVA